MKKFLFQLFMASRGYSVSMSVLSWLIVFVWVLINYSQSNILFGIYALLGVVAAHIGTNLFDDFVDHSLNVPKQKCKTQYIEEGFLTVKGVLFLALLCFTVSLLIGLFFFFKFGLPVLYISLCAGIIILLYPKLNNFALGEAGVGITFGPLLFSGVSYVMAGVIEYETILVSVPAGLLIAIVLYVHSLMDYDFDKANSKKTLCVRLGTKQNALYGMVMLYLLTFLLTVFYAVKGILPPNVLLTLFLIPIVIKLYINLKKYIENPEEKEFMINFKLSRNIFILYSLILILVLIFQR